MILVPYTTVLFIFAGSDKNVKRTYNILGLHSKLPSTYCGIDWIELGPSMNSLLGWSLTTGLILPAKASAVPTRSNIHDVGPLSIEASFANKGKSRWHFFATQPRHNLF